MTPPDRARASFRDWVAVVGTSLGAFIAVIDIQITNASLKQIQGSLAASLDEGSWISTGYLVAEMVVIPMTVWLSAVFSFRYYLVGSTFLFVIFSVLCGMSTSLPEMILFRVGQGFTGGCLIPASFTMAATTVPPSQRSVALVIAGVSVSLAPAIGPSVGGWLTDTFSWHYIFYINVIPCFALIAMILYGLDPKPMQLGRLRNADYPGMIAMAIGLGTLVVVLEEGQRKDWLGSALIRDCAIAAAVSLIAATLIEVTRKDPFINLKLLRNPAFAAICLGSAASGLGMYAISYVLPLYLAQVQGYDAGQIGRLMMWQGLPQLCVFPLMAMLMQRFDHRLLITIGLVIFAGSAFMNAALSHDSAGDQMFSALVGRGVGVPLISPPLSALIPFTLAARDIPDASALYNAMRNLGGSVGIALLSTFASVRENFHFSMIAERVTQNSALLQDRLAGIAARLGDGGEAGLGQARAVGLLAQTVRREALVMAYGDCFFIMGAVLLGSIAIVPLLARPRRGRPAAAGGGR